MIMTTKFNDLEIVTQKKIVFIYNALENGWNISKNDNYYIFRKKHENKKEIFTEDYLKNFICECSDISKANVHELISKTNDN